MEDNANGLRGFETLMVVLVCLAAQAVFTSRAYGDAIVGWGRNDEGQVSSPSGNDFIAVAAGGYHSLALTSEGSIVAWGDNFHGQAMSPEGTDFTVVAAGQVYSLALKSDGTIVGWGGNYSGQATPPKGTGFTAVAAGAAHSLALTSDGSIVGWGYNDYGQATPPEGSGFTAISAGMYHSLALTSDGSIVAWGRNNYGQATPPKGNGFIAIATGAIHSLALTSDGSIVGWGSNVHWDGTWVGQATPPAGNGFIAIAAGGYHSLALKSDGSVIGWGDNRYGQTEPPAGNHLTAIAAGGSGSHSLALVSTNSQPVADAGPDQTLECSCQSGGTEVTLNGTGSSDPDGAPLIYTWTGPFDGSPVAGANPTVMLLPGCQGAYPITLVVNAGQEDSAPDEVVITVQDTTAPAITCPTPITVEAQGPDGVLAGDSQIQAFLGAANVTDNCDPAPELSNNAPTTYFPITIPLESGGTPTTVTFTATDVSGNTATEVSTVYVDDTTPPEISIVAPEPYGLYAAGSLALDFSAHDLVSGSIAPPDLLGTLSDAQSSWSVEPGYVPPVGVYTLTLSAKDSAANVADSEPVSFVVYDPEGGFVTGGGWIWSPSGAYRLDESLTGKANFGFVSKYEKGATEPTGQTEFVFQAGDLKFHSSSYDWLVVTGSNYARFKGAGTINDYGYYKFMLWAGDGPDTFRIKIWEEDEGDGTEYVVYDNGDDQAIDGGSIVIHTN